MKTGIVITGVAGFIGSVFAKSFDLSKYNIYGIDDLSSGDKKSVPKKINFYKQDLSKKVPKSLKHSKIKIDYVFHFAGQSSGEISFENPVSDLKKNTITTLNLIEFSIKKKIKKFFYMSSMSVYGDTEFADEKSVLDPKSCYGVSKMSSEYYLKVFSKELNYVIFRLFNVYGPSQKLNNLKQGMIRIYMTQFIKNNEIIVKGSLNRKRDFIFIDDVIHIFKLALNDNQNKNFIINVGTGKKITVKKIISEFLKIKNKKIKVIKGTKGDQKTIYANTTKLKNIYPSIKFTNINKGIRAFYDKAK